MSEPKVAQLKESALANFLEHLLFDWDKFIFSYLNPAILSVFMAKFVNWDWKTFQFDKTKLYSSNQA